MKKTPHGGHGRERRRRRHRRGLGGHLQGRVAQPPQLHRAVPGAPRPASAASCATSSRWARARSPSWTRCASAPSTTPTPPASVHGVVGGISFYGNCLGLPNIGGETVLRRGVPGQPARQRARGRRPAPRGPPRSPTRRGAGNKVVLFGARTGGDGIGGASILASDTFADGGPAKRPAVQVGDPFAEKVLIECCLELSQATSSRRIQDLGAAGISCATTSELAANGDGGHARRPREGAAARPYAHAGGDPHDRRARSA